MEKIIPFELSFQLGLLDFLVWVDWMGSPMAEIRTRELSFEGTVVFLRHLFFYLSIRDNLELPLRMMLSR